MDVFTPMWVYIVECCDGTYYTGVTRDLPRRIHQHNHSNGAEYTKIRWPVKLVYSEKLMSHAEAYRKEKEIKGFSHDWKRGLVEQYEQENHIVYTGYANAQVSRIV